VEEADRERGTMTDYKAEAIRRFARREMEWAKSKGSVSKEVNINRAWLDGYEAAMFQVKSYRPKLRKPKRRQ
jgi:hypothetical protein